MKRLMALILAVGVAGAAGMEISKRPQRAIERPAVLQNTIKVHVSRWTRNTKDTGWFSYAGDPYYLTWSGPYRATYFNPADFSGVGYPITIDSVRALFFQHPNYPWDTDTIFKFIILDGDGSTVLDTSPWFYLPDTAGVILEIRWGLPNPINRTDGQTWYVVIDPTVNGQSSGHPSTLADNVSDNHSFYGDFGNWSVWPYGEYFIDCFLDYTPPPHDVGVAEAQAPATTIENGALVTPQVSVANYGSFTETFTVYCNIYLEGTTNNVYSDNQSVTLAPGDTLVVNFSDWEVPSHGRYMVNYFTVLSTDVFPTNDSLWITSYAVNKGRDFLVLDFDGALFLDYPQVGHSPTGVANALQRLGYSGWYDRSGAYFNRDSLNLFKEVWLFLGQYPYNVSITTTGGAVIDSFLKVDHGRMFLEGGDCWYYDPAQGYYDPNPTFGTRALGDGASPGDLDTIVGITNTLIPEADGGVWVNTAFNNYVDSLDANPFPPNGGVPDQVLKNLLSGAYVGIAYDQGDYKTFASSGVLGGYTELSKTSLDSLVAWIWNFLSPCTCGDLNDDGNVDPMDLVYMTAYFFQGGPAPAYPSCADVDGSGTFDKADIAYLANYLFLNGPAPDCP